MSGRPRIAVYAIAKNEARHVARWAASAREADLILLADTGSTDETVTLADGLGVTVARIEVAPFRFDVARNLALAALPADIDLCLSLDLDEVLAPGWRALAETAWHHGATRIRALYEWRWDVAAPPLRFTIADRIHARAGYRWHYPVHEAIVSPDSETVIGAPIEFHHLRDPHRPWAIYADLLELALRENPDDGRVAHLAANEARMAGRSDEARMQFRRALELPLGPNERLHAMLMLAHLEPEARAHWLGLATTEFPARREPWCELAQLNFDLGQWRACRAVAQIALRITRPADDYLANPHAWGAWPDRLAALASFDLGDTELALHHARSGVRAAPDDPELIDLLAWASRPPIQRGAGSQGCDQPEE